MTGPPAVSVSDLTKTFRSRSGTVRALDGLTLDVPQGQVLGLLGPNGSGKTTLLRTLFGLVRPDAGRVRVFGRDVPRDLPLVVRSMGGLVEGPALAPDFTGRRNLEVLAAIRGIEGRKVEEVLETVGLSDRADDRVRGYSLGMRQRLAIAAALLGTPRLLILDEPSNGLDPAGMVQMRDLVERLAADPAVTVIVSSHLIGELERICSLFAIIHRGALVATGTLAELTGGLTGKTYVRLTTPDPAAALAVLTSAGFDAEQVPGGVRVADITPREALDRLADRDVPVTSLVQEGHTLEDRFLALTRTS